MEPPPDGAVDDRRERAARTLRIFTPAWLGSLLLLGLVYVAVFVNALQTGGMHREIEVLAVSAAVVAVGGSASGLGIALRGRFPFAAAGFAVATVISLAACASPVGSALGG
ncbi:hypothetical protein AB0I28_00750 [Phytomonospora sp. NPDC050363]|uniref:hypothetical protein n=1 Tax=Phytomonospora sp. NPDC050363 TaxID=3155642 RepID=UPI0033D8B523